MNYPRIAQLRTAEEFAQRIRELGLALEFDETMQSGPESPLGQSYNLRNGFRIGNRLCVHPMEGWDGTAEGLPSELTLRRWERFGASGAKLIWGGEAVAVSPDSRANPRQLMASEATLGGLADLRLALVKSHRERWGADDLYIGLQLTHSGRFSRPHEGKRMEPRILYSHPLLNRKFGLAEDYPVLSDDAIRKIVDDHVRAAKLAKRAGYAFVDVKHCHGYLGHEFLSAVNRPGSYGGSFENRTRYLREVVQGIRAEAPGLEIGVRLSMFDFIPFKPGADGIGEPETWSGPYPYAFGGDGSGVRIDLTEPDRFLGVLEEMGIELVNLTAGSPYYNPHIQRPAMFPPSDGYQPPEDPLVGAARQLAAAAELKRRHPKLLTVGSAFSYFQEWLPHVAQNAVRTGKIDFAGIGRMVLSYPEIWADVLEGRPLQRKRICRTFSECTTAPRQGRVSGCYPLDEHYKQLQSSDS
jgi:NADPH2 dehydrogenase